MKYILMVLSVLLSLHAVQAVADGTCESNCMQLQNDPSLQPSGWSYSQCTGQCTDRPPHTAIPVKIEGCSMLSLENLHYGSGNKHEFCLNNQWKGGEISGACWKVTDGETTVATAKNACPRLFRYYNVAGKPGSCDHLRHEDVAKIKAAGGQIDCK